MSWRCRNASWRRWPSARSAYSRRAIWWCRSASPSRGNFLAFEHADAQAWYRRLHEVNIVTDVRGSRLRVGFGLYQTAQDVDALVARLRTLT